MTSWNNWSGSVRATPARIERPKTEAGLAEIIRQSDKVRVVGAGHSFMPLCETTGTLFSLADLEGTVELAEEGTVWAPAGWGLDKLTAALWEKGYSLSNQGDVNPQALAGAIGTGTHGTGTGIGTLSTMARAFRLVQADGSIVECSPTERPDLFEAARLSLGLVGVATRIKIAVLPAYHLEERIDVRFFAEVEEQWPTLMAATRHVEFFVFPYSDKVVLKTLNPVPAPAEQQKLGTGDVSDFGETLFRWSCDLGRAVPMLIPGLQRLLMKGIGPSKRVGPAYQIFPSARTVKFEEMEYELPRANGFAALKEVVGWIRKNRLPVTFPFEFRVVAGDDVWLSPFHIGEGASISMHQYRKLPYELLFADAEKMFLAHGGRPHWAKRHTLTSNDLRRLYPRFDDFRRVRESVDPGGKFANTLLSELFDVGQPVPAGAA